MSELKPYSKAIALLLKKTVDESKSDEEVNAEAEKKPEKKGKGTKKTENEEEKSEEKSPVFDNPDSKVE